MSREELQSAVMNHPAAARSEMLKRYAAADGVVKRAAAELGITAQTWRAWALRVGIADSVRGTGSGRCRPVPTTARMRSSGFLLKLIGGTMVAVPSLRSAPGARAFVVIRGEDWTEPLPAPRLARSPRVPSDMGESVLLALAADEEPVEKEPAE